MKWFLLLLSTNLFSLTFENIPFFNPEAPHQIAFSIAKNFSDGSLKPSFLQEMQQFFHLNTFIESGTYTGNTAAIASQIFDEVHTIELLPEFYQNAFRRFRHTPHVHLYLGDSGEVLDLVLPHTYQKKILFYLDGHYDGGKSGQGVLNTPILKELASIRRFHSSDNLILVDDLCDFEESLYPEKITGTCFEGYPSLTCLLEALFEINPSYQIVFFGNALLAFPPSPDVTVTPVACACSVSRLASIADFFPEKLILDAEQAIAEARGKEKRELELYYQAYCQFEWDHGWRSFSSLWYGLMLKNQGRLQEAARIFSLAAKHSPPGWRINYLN
jgi:hypothetical protein